MKISHMRFMIACIACVATQQLYTSMPDDNQVVRSHVYTLCQKPMGANPYTYAPQLFNAEGGVTGRLWAGNGSDEYPGKAYIDDIEYTDIVIIKSADLHQKADKKLRNKIKNLRKGKDSLGSYIDEATNIEYNIYGVKKYPNDVDYADQIDDRADAGVLTQIAIGLDYGPGE